MCWAEGCNKDVVVAKVQSGTRVPGPVPSCTPTTDYVTTEASVELDRGTVLVPTSQCDNCMVSIQLPFTFYLYGQPFNFANASSNGNLQFGSSNSSPANTCLVNSGLNNAILPYWADLDMDPSLDPTLGIYTSQG